MGILEKYFKSTHQEVKIPFVIEQDHCLHCGNCLSVCPQGAVEKISD
ncbi:MAG TPA: hypothetical protein DCQ87_03510 [Lachnospiraceae bacterium]|nr:hypothetical protein [Lachnospiraceae bacterium]